MITQAELKRVLKYDPMTGIFTYRVTRGRMRAGDRAGCIHRRGYRSIMVDGAQRTAGRLAVLYMTGRWPKEFVDHINHVRDDNRWENIRVVSCQENQRNQTLNIRNTSGVTGVGWCEVRKKWRTAIQTKGRRKSLGVFTDFDKAVAARKAAEIKYNYHPNHGSKT